MSQESLLILNKLAQNNEIISKVIVPVLLADLKLEQNINTDFLSSVSSSVFSPHSTNPFTKRNLNSLACLNRLCELNSKSEILNQLVQILG